MAAALVASLFMSSCSQRLLDFTLISTKNVNLKETHESSNFRVKGKDVRHTVLFIPFGTPDIKEAIDDAIEQTPGCVALENGVLKYKWWSILLYGQSRYIIEGTPVMKSSSAAADTQEYQYMVTPADGGDQFVITK